MTTAPPIDSTLTEPVPSSVEKKAAALDASKQFRPDLEGLRGLAVLSILAVHTFPGWVRGGLVGVDIFFVLSGFLIATTTFADVAQGRFRIGAFYARRVVRIVPILSVVLLVTLVFAFLFPASQETHVFAHDGSPRVGHVEPWFDTGASAGSPGAALSPLLHLWPLLVEACFYALWPVALVVLWRRRPQAAWWLAGAVAILGLIAFSAGETGAGPWYSFSLRAAELLAGTLLATRSLGDHRPLPARLSNVLGWSGWLVLVVALGVEDQAAHHAVAWSMSTAASTLLMLAAGPASGSSVHVLSNRVLRFYGSVSFPLCLWHWPLLAAPLIVGIPLSNDVRVMILIAAVALAALSLELIERPARAATVRPYAAWLWLAVLCAIGLGAVLATPSAPRLDCLAQGDDSGPCAWRSMESAPR